MKRLLRSILLSILASFVSLVVGTFLVLGANSGIHPIFATAGLIWLATIGLPTTIAVVVAASVWGQIDPLTGLRGFLILSVVLAVLLHIAAFLFLRRCFVLSKGRGRLWNFRWPIVIGLAVAALLVAGLCISRRALPPLPEVIDGHAHLFGDEGWPPIHGQTTGLSPAQKANPTYSALIRLLRLPATGNLDKLYVEELVRQAREARQKLGSFRAVLLAQDCRYTSEGDPDWETTSVYVPNARLFQVVSNYPDLFIPCPSINPQRKDWEAELDNCLTRGARILKIHPPTQAVDPSDPRFRNFYRKCARNGMRIMVHTGSEHSAPITSPTLGDPRLVKLALDEGCTVIAAHAGTKAFFDPPAEDYFHALVEMMSESPRLYADTAVLGSLFRWRCVPMIVRTSEVLPKIVHGSDWPFPANALVSWHRLNPRTLIELMSEKNLFVRDARLKQALGMPPETFNQISSLLPEVRHLGDR